MTLVQHIGSLAVPMASINSERLAPTEEQRAILDAEGRVVRINARAGTGKTTTLRLLAERFRDQKVLYVVFNRRARQEAEATFPDHVDVRTVHSLAMKSVARGFKWQLARSGGLSTFDLLPAFGDMGSRQQVMAGLTAEFLVYFLNSAHPKLEDAVEPFGAHYLSEEQQRDFAPRAERIVDVARTLTTDWHHGRTPCPHDFYLKLSHKTGRLVRALDRFDVVLVDEGQDLSQVMLDALRQCAHQIYLVGDSHQQIYGFRYAVDAMKRLDADKELELSLSFRFGEPIARLASAFIQEAKGEFGFEIRGNPERTSSVATQDDAASRVRGRDRAILARTNLGLFNTAVGLHERGASCVFERSIGPLLNRALDVYWLYDGQRASIRDPLIRSFPDFSQLKDYAEEMEDFQLRELAKVVERYNRKMPTLVSGLSAFAKNSPKERGGGAIVLSTVHAAKGEEYGHVVLHEDISNALNRAIKYEAERRVDEEANVAYVAMTRAIEHLVLPDDLNKELDLAWETFTKTPSTTSHSRDNGHPKSEPRELKVDDRVETHSGPGRIVQVGDDGRYVVALEDQSVKVRERASELKRIEG